MYSRNPCKSSDPILVCPQTGKAAGCSSPWAGVQDQPVRLVTTPAAAVTEGKGGRWWREAYVSAVARLDDEVESSTSSSSTSTSSSSTTSEGLATETRTAEENTRSVVEGLIQSANRRDYRRALDLVLKMSRDQWYFFFSPLKNLIKQKLKLI